MDDIRIAMLGFGNVGQALGDILLDKAGDVIALFGRGIRVTAITTGSRGCLYEPDGIDLGRALKEIRTSGRFSCDNPDLAAMDSMSVVRTGEYDVLVEMTPLNIETGLPAADHIREALERGKHAVSANKGPVAWYYRRLMDMAEKRELCFFFESTVMDGTPIFDLNDSCLRLSGGVTEIEGILNTTTNFVLKKLEEGCTYEEALEEGRIGGFVEKDPSMDIDGYDAAAKVAVLMNALMDTEADITPRDVDRHGIAGVTLNDIQDARKRGMCLKLMCRGTMLDGKPVASVKLEELPMEHIYAAVDGTSSVLSLTTELMGRLTLVEHEPTPVQTGYGVFKDLLRVLDRERIKNA